MFFFFKENSYYAQNRGNGSFWGPESILFNFSLNLLIRFFWNTFLKILLILFFWNYAEQQAFKSGLKLLFWKFKENSYYAENRVNTSSVRTVGDPL